MSASPVSWRPFFGLLLLVLSLCACQQEKPPFEPGPILPERLAWVGEDGEVRVVAEALSPPPHPEAEFFEEDLLRDFFSLSEDISFIRLHIFSDSPALLSDSGHIVLEDGSSFLPMPDVGGVSLEPSKRLLRDVLLRGGGNAGEKASANTGRRQFVCGGRGVLRHKPSTVHWVRGERKLLLTLRSWTEASRREFIEGPPVLSHE